MYVSLSTLCLFSALLFTVGSWQQLAIIYGIIGFFHGGLYSASGALLMDITNPKIGATQYSLLTSLANMGEMGAGAVSGSLISAIGFGRLFLFSGWIYGPALLILYFIRCKTPFFLPRPSEVTDAA
jgi:MFS family permease